MYQDGQPAGLLGVSRRDEERRPAAAAVLYRWPDVSCLLDVCSRSSAGWSAHEKAHLWGDFIRLLREEAGPRLTWYYEVGGGFEDSLDESLTLEDVQGCIGGFPHNEEDWTSEFWAALAKLGPEQVAGVLLGLVQTRVSSIRYLPFGPDVDTEGLPVEVLAWKPVEFSPRNPQQKHDAMFLRVTSGYPHASV
jgi:hypothetical protein